MGLTTVGDLSSIQEQFKAIKEEIDKHFDKTILTLEETSWAVIRKKKRLSFMVNRLDNDARL